MEALQIDYYGNPITFYCRNNGTEIRRNIQLKCPLPVNVPLLYPSGGLYAGSGTTAVIQIDSILPGQTFMLNLTTGVTANNFKVKDKVTWSVKLDSLTDLADDVKSNNAISEFRLVDATIKPNQKNVSVDSVFTTADKQISYTIHFRNTGTKSAQRVVITDTLDKQYHDLSKFTLNWSDYPCETLIADNVVYFIFDNIMLAPATLRSAVNFTVGLKSNVSADAAFKNRATVYFEETPVVTPVTNMRIISPVRITKLLRANLCLNERNNKVFYSSSVKLESGNQVIVELSDNTGSFSSPTVLKTVTTVSKTDSIDFIFPGSMAAGNYKVRIRTTNPAYTGIASSGSTNLTVSPVPVFSISTNLYNNGLCVNDTLKITCIGSGLSYKTMKNSISLNNFTTAVLYKIPGIVAGDKVRVIGRDNTSQCKDTLSLSPGILQRPTITISAKNSKVEVCRNDIFVLQGSGGVKYQFLRNDTIFSPKLTVDSISILGNYTAKFKVLGESIEGCTNISPFINITVNPIPKAFQVTASPNKVCVGDSFTFNYSDAAISYETFRNDTMIRSKTGNTPFRTRAFKITDQFSVTGINAKGCTLKNGNSNLILLPYPKKPVIGKNVNTISVDPLDIQTFKWYRDGNLLPDNTNFINNAQNGTYYCIVTNYSGCSSRSDDLKFTRTGVNDIYSNTLKVYPNPASELLTVELEDSPDHVLSLYDISGKLVLQVQANEERTEMNISGLQSGIYILKAMDSSGREYVRMVSIGKR